MNIIIKITSSVCAGFAMASLFLTSASAQDLTAKLGNVSIVSVDRMSLTNTGSAYQLAVDITFRNNNSEPIRFRNADLEVTLNTLPPGGTNEVLDLGLSHLDEVVLPGLTENHAGTITSTATIPLGSVDEATHAKLVKLFNSMSDPGNKVSLLLSGSSALDLKLPNGFVGEVGRRFEVDLTFNPSLQRKVLLN